MKTFKVHIAKQVIEGKVITTVSECGRKAFTQNGSPNVIYKTSGFKLVFDNDIESCCLVCREKAKSQNRV